jgi:hypothetical protein
MKKNPGPLLLMTIINRFEINCGTFRRGVGKNPTIINDTKSISPKIKNNFKIKIKITMTMGWILTY